jgi:hypothetical protein
VTRRDRSLERLLRWYPKDWRDRYGAELITLVEDDLEGRRPTLRCRADLAVSGLRERGNSSGLTGDRAPAAVRCRSGNQAVLCAWTLLVAAGCVFAKVTEPSGDASRPSRWLADTSRFVVMVAAIVAAVAVVGAALLCVRPFVRLVHRPEWREARRHLTRAAMLSAVAAASTAGLVWWAHRLAPATVDRGSGMYGVAFVAWAAVVIGALAAWTTAAVVVVNRLDLPARSLRATTALAGVVTTAMLVATTSAALWTFDAMRGAPMAHAPWFAIGAIVAMVAADVLALAGVRRSRTVWIDPSI